MTATKSSQGLSQTIYFGPIIKISTNLMNFHPCFNLLSQI